MELWRSGNSDIRAVKMVNCGQQWHLVRMRPYFGGCSNERIWRGRRIVDDKKSDKEKKVKVGGVDSEMWMRGHGGEVGR